MQKLIFSCSKVGKHEKYTPSKAEKLLPIRITYKDSTGEIKFCGCLKEDIRGATFHKSLRRFRGNKESHLIVDILLMLGELLFFKALYSLCLRW